MGKVWVNMVNPRHGLFIYNSTVHVPLLIRLPGGKARRVEQLVRHIDLAPTILDLLGVSSSKKYSGSESHTTY